MKETIKRSEVHLLLAEIIKAQIGKGDETSIIESMLTKSRELGLHDSVVDMLYHISVNNDCTINTEPMHVQTEKAVSIFRGDWVSFGDREADRLAEYLANLDESCMSEDDYLNEMDTVDFIDPDIWEQHIRDFYGDLHADMVQAKLQDKLRRRATYFKSMNEVIDNRI